jgi:hypothetical protein
MGGAEKSQGKETPHANREVLQSLEVSPLNFLTYHQPRRVRKRFVTSSLGSDAFINQDPTMRNPFPILAALVCLFALAATGRAGAQVFLNYSVNQPPALAAQAGADQIICPGDPATLGGSPTATGGYGAYSYVWFPNSTLNNAAAANPVASPSQSTTYALTLTDSLGCTALDTITITVDTCVGIGNAQAIHAFDVHPNPNDGKFTVEAELGATMEAVTLRVVDAAGREVFAKTISQPGATIREQLSLNALSQGTYFIRLEANGNQVSRRMIIHKP